MLFHNFRRGLALFTGNDGHTPSERVRSDRVQSARHSTLGCHRRQLSFRLHILPQSSIMLKSLLTLSIFAAAVFAQNADIGLPVENQAVQQGSDLIVQIQRPVCSTLYPRFYRSRLLFLFISRTPSQALKRLLSLSVYSLVRTALARYLRTSWALSCTTDRLTHNTTSNTCRRMRTLL